jgi:subtilisin family serine protease
LDSGDPKPRCLPSCRVYLGEGNQSDEFGHATAIASILFGGNGITGICEGARSYYVKVLDDNGKGTVKSVVDGIYWAIDNNIDLINLSLGFMRTEKCPKSLEKACNMAREAGKVVFCAAGNDGGPVNWPAALRSTICVGSIAENGLKSSFSSVGEVDFVAPGQNLRVLNTNGNVISVSGTSFSTALVTGVAALIVAKMKAKNPKSVCFESIRWSLRRMSSDIDAPGWDKMTGYGLISGKKRDPTVCLGIETGFFGKIINKLKSLIGGKTRSK